MAGGSSPCASCKLLRRRCAKNCIFSPYFPSNDPHKFAIVHKIFGASNISKMLQELPFHERSDAVSSLVFEATARMKDPVYGCVSAISYLQSQISKLQMQLAVTQAEILCIQMQQDHHQQQPAAAAIAASLSTTDHQQMLRVEDDKSCFFNNINHNNLIMNNNINISHLFKGDDFNIEYLFSF